MPDDPWGYRAEIIKAFRLRGIRPGDVNSYSEEALRWRAPSEHRGAVAPLTGLPINLWNVEDMTAAKLKKQSQETAQQLHRYADRHRRQFGLDAKLKFQVYSYHPIWRVRPDGALAIDYVVEFIQSRKEHPKSPHGQPFDFRGGTTVIFDRHGAVRYAIEKSVTSRTRLKWRRAFEAETSERSALATFQPGKREPLNFAAIHRWG